MIRFTLASACCLFSSACAIYVSCLFWGAVLSGPIPFGLLCLIYLGAMFAGGRSFATVWNAGR